MSEEVKKTKAPAKGVAAPVGLFPKISRIMSEIGVLPKNGYNKHFNYNFVSYDDIVSRVSELMVTYGVISYHTDVTIGEDEAVSLYNVEGAKIKHKSFRTYGAKVVYVDIDTGEKIVTGPFYGEAERLDDKGIRKAERQASKIADLTTFKIVTGEPDFGELTSEPAQESRTVQKAAPSRAATAQPKKTVAPKVDTTELTELQTKLGTKFGSKDKAIEVGTKMFPDDKNWVTNPDKLRKLIDASTEA